MINTISDCFPFSELIVFVFFFLYLTILQMNNLELMLHVARKQVLYFLFTKDNWWYLPVDKISYIYYTYIK
jgi:hypothetical protein